MSTHLGEEPAVARANPSPTPHENDSKWISIPGSERQYNRQLILFVVLIPLAMALFQVSSVNVALSSIAHSVHASPSQLQWVLSGYALALGLSLVPAGRVGDIFGRAEVFVGGLILFSLFSTSCGLVHDPTLLNILRIFQGLAAGIYSPQVTGLIQQYFQGQARAKAFALVGFAISVSVALGPLMTGALITILGADNGWRASFIINLPLGIIGTIAAWRWLPFRTVSSRRHPNAATSRPKVDLDPFGMALLSVSVVLLMLPFMLHNHPWRWWLLLVATIGGVSWVLWERAYARRGRAPVVDLGLFGLSSFSFNVGIAALNFLGITSVFAIAAIYLQEGLGKSAMLAALICVPNAIAAAVASLWAGKHAITHGPGLQAFAVSCITVGVFSAGMCALMVPHGWSPWTLSVGFAIQGFGQGSMASINQTQAMQDVPTIQGGVAGGVIQTVQRISTAIGTAMMTGLFFTLIGDKSVATVDIWSHAAAISYSTITALMLCCTVLAVIYWLVGRRGVPAKQH
ncbi:MFS transporter [Corynebacterium caspium]|uniref:MFS transporter n=1 Tax=Corynebacterium caspium TaxID=234828 RepID=UPI001B7FB22A|nr:MFS transporter [Corynebacterium caspium]